MLESRFFVGLLAEDDFQALFYYLLTDRLGGQLELWGPSGGSLV